MGRASVHVSWHAAGMMSGVSCCRFINEMTWCSATAGRVVSRALLLAWEQAFEGKRGRDR